MHDLQCMVVNIVRILQTDGTAVKIDEKRMGLAKTLHEVELEKTQQAQKDQQFQYVTLIRCWQELTQVSYKKCR